MKYYFALQYTMLNRKLREFGLPPAAAYLLILITFIAFSYFLFIKTALAPYIYAVVALIFVLPLSENDRNDFLKSTFTKSTYPQIRMVENMLVVFPFALFLTSQLEWLLGIAVLVAGGFFALFNFRNQWNYTIPTPFYKFPFEFTIGFRNTYWIFAFAYFLTVMAIQVGNFNLGIFAQVTVFIGCLFFYGKPEDEYFVWIFAKTPQQFIFSKLKTALLYCSLLTLPILISMTIFFIDKWWILLLVQFAAYFYLITMVLAKYAAYPREINLPQTIIFTLGIWLPPLLLGIIPFFYKKSMKSLSRWLEPIKP